MTREEIMDFVIETANEVIKDAFGIENNAWRVAQDTQVFPSVIARVSGEISSNVLRPSNTPAGWRITLISQGKAYNDAAKLDRLLIEKFGSLHRLQGTSDAEDAYEYLEHIVYQCVRVVEIV